MLAAVQQQCCLKNSQRNCRKFVSHKIAYDAIMKKTLLPPCPSFVKLGGQCHRSPASLLTAISSHHLADLPTKMSEFSNYMRQNA